MRSIDQPQDVQPLPPPVRPPAPGPKPILGRPNWYTQGGKPYYVEPDKPLSRSQLLTLAGYARRPTWRSLPSDE